MEASEGTRKYTPEEKQQLLANLDLELEHRARQLESWLNDTCENFRVHAESIISRVPKAVRNMSLEEFATKYDGDVQAAMMGINRERLMEVQAEEIAKSPRKRKWVADADGRGDAESSKGSKNARLVFATPKKKAGFSTAPGSAQKAKQHFVKTPGGSRIARYIPSPSPAKPVGAEVSSSSSSTVPFPKIPSSRSPSKPTAGPSHLQTRVPSSSFNPSLPSKTPSYPPIPRWPRPEERLLSLNGSPIANPFERNEPSDPTARERTLKRVNSIVIREKPSSSFTSHSEQSQSSRASSDSQTTATTATTSRSSQSSITSVSSQESTSSSTPTPTSTFARALISLPTKSGHILEFDPLETTPAMVDALEGLTNSAKKQAKEEMTKLVMAAVDKWWIQ